MLNPQPFPPAPQDDVDRFVTRNLSYASAAKEVEYSWEARWRPRLVGVTRVGDAVPLTPTDPFGKNKRDENHVGYVDFGGGYHNGFYDEWDFHHYMDRRQRDIDLIEADPFDDAYQLEDVPKNAFENGSNGVDANCDGTLSSPSYPSAAPCVWCAR